MDKILKYTGYLLIALSVVLAVLLIIMSSTAGEWIRLDVTLLLLGVLALMIDFLIGQI